MATLEFGLVDGAAEFLGERVDVRIPPGGRTLGDLLADVLTDETAGEGRKLLFDDAGHLRPDIVVLLNGRGLPRARDLGTPVDDADTVVFVQAALGG